MKCIEPSPYKMDFLLAGGNYGRGSVIIRSFTLESRRNPFSRIETDMPNQNTNTTVFRFLYFRLIWLLKSCGACTTKSDEIVHGSGIEAVVSVGYTDAVRMEVPTTAAKNTRGFDIYKVIVNE